MPATFAWSDRQILDGLRALGRECPQGAGQVHCGNELVQGVVGLGEVLSPHPRSFVGKSFRQLQEAADGSALRLVPQLRMGDTGLVDEPSDLFGRDITSSF
jgi:hypothetical protein